VSASINTLVEPTKRPNGLYPVTLAVADYDRTRPLIDGRVKPEGIALTTNTSWIGDFCVRPVYEEYDAAEMSLSWYVMARTRGEPVVALPVFPLRMPVLAYVFVREDSSYTKPSDLVGKRVASILYRITVNLWLRGIFAEFYGLKPHEVEWVVTVGEEGAGFRIPSGVRLTKDTSATPEQLLERGDVDAIFLPELPDGWVPGQSRIRRLFSDTQAEMRAFVQRTGMLPITHTVVMNKGLADREPWIARSMTQAFCDAQDVCDAHLNADPKHTSLPDMVHFLEEQRAAYGPKPYVQGIEANRKVLDTFVRYAYEQGYIPRVPTLEELFPSFG
jgi:4,5-dihydroxyphthalate decarboxylase